MRVSPSSQAAVGAMEKRWFWRREGEGETRNGMNGLEVRAREYDRGGGLVLPQFHEIESQTCGASDGEGNGLKKRKKEEWTRPWNPVPLASWKLGGKDGRGHSGDPAPMQGQFTSRRGWGRRAGNRSAARYLTPGQLRPACISCSQDCLRMLPWRRSLNVAESAFGGRLADLYCVLCWEPGVDFYNTPKAKAVHLARCLQAETRFSPEMSQSR